MIKKRYLWSVFVFMLMHMTSYGAMNLFSPTGGIPIDITSDDGMKIDQENQVIIATGNATVVRQGVTLVADRLVAFYEKDSEGNTNFWRIDAEGNLKITSEDGVITGKTGTYDVRQEIVVIKGEPVVVTGDKGKVIAHKQIEYYDTERRIIARGAVEATSEDKTLLAEVAEVFLKPESENTQEGEGDNTLKAAEDMSSLASDVDQVRAYTDITLKNQDATVTGDRGIWFADEEKATLTGKVQLEQDGNILNGCRAEVDTSTGSSKLIGGDCNDKNQGVTGLFKNND
ncbi:MAG: LptA/OstA family protein [Alphaproteobacteria bacterium]